MLGLSQKIYTLLKDKANSLGKSINEYIEDSKVNFVIINEKTGRAFEWADKDGDWVAYGSREDAQIDTIFGDDNHEEKVITEYDYLVSLGLAYMVSSGSSFPIDLILTPAQIEKGYHSGPCDADIDELKQDESIKEQLRKLSDTAINMWWDEMFVDDTEEEHRTASRDRKLAWLIFDACANATDDENKEVAINYQKEF